jgi:hypothetical protein
MRPQRRDPEISDLAQSQCRRGAISDVLDLMAAKKSLPKKTHTWEITLIRERGKFLGYVEAPDADASIKQAIQELQITNPEQQRRLIARRTS